MNQVTSIAVGFDGSVESETALRWAAGMAHESGASLTVLHASGILERLGSAFEPDVVPEAVARIMVEEGIDSSRFHWVIEEGDACSALLQCASEPVSAQVLVVGSRGHGKRPGTMIGSVSLEVVQHAKVPVVVVPGS